MIESQEAERRAQIVAQFMEQGKAAVQAGKKAQARYYFQAALEAVPDHPDALLWLAFLAGGGQPSLVYLARLLDADPTNQRARQAIRWARKRAQPRTDQLAVSPVHKPVWNRRRLGTLAGLVAWMIIVLGGVFTAAFALDLPLATPTWAQSIAVLATATPLPSDTPSPTPTATPTDFPSPTASPLPSNTPTATPTSTPTATPTPIPPTSTPLPTVTAVPTAFPTAPVGDTFRWIDVDLTHQRLVAYEGDTPVRTVSVSTGASRTPTVTGRFKIYAKYKTANMSGPGYNLPNVPYVMYFYGGYGLHGTYWHTNFGQPMSHGCVNLPTPDAEWLYNWASVGTPVVVHY